MNRAGSNNRISPLMNADHCYFIRIHIEVRKYPGSSSSSQGLVAVDTIIAPSVSPPSSGLIGSAQNLLFCVMLECLWRRTERTDQALVSSKAAIAIIATRSVEVTVVTAKPASHPLGFHSRGGIDDAFFCLRTLLLAALFRTRWAVSTVLF